MLKTNSILKNLPNLPLKQFMVLDTIRFIIEIIGINYNDLITELERISISNDKRNAPKVFNCLWNIIDNIQRLNQIYIKHSGGQLSLFKDLVEAKFFRHSYQHPEDRITELLADKKLPVFGTIKWRVNDSNKPFTCLLISGDLYGAEMEIFNPSSVSKSTKLIADITLMSTVRKSSQTIEQEISISELISNLEKDILTLENGLMESCKKSNIETQNREHTQDVLMRFYNDKN